MGDMLLVLTLFAVIYCLNNIPPSTPQAKAALNAVFAVLIVLAALGFFFLGHGRLWGP